MYKCSAFYTEKFIPRHFPSECLMKSIFHISYISGNSAQNRKILYGIWRQSLGREYLIDPRIKAVLGKPKRELAFGIVKRAQHISVSGPGAFLWRNPRGSCWDFKRLKPESECGSLAISDWTPRMETESGLAMVMWADSRWCAVKCMLPYTTDLWSSVIMALIEVWWNVASERVYWITEGLFCVRQHRSPKDIKLIMHDPDPSRPHSSINSPNNPSWSN